MMYKPMALIAVALVLAGPVSTSLDGVEASGTGASNADSVAVDTELFFRSGPTGIGPLDMRLGSTSMEEAPPEGDTPSMWYSAPVVGGMTGSEATWTWKPAGGYNFEDAEVNVTFWAVSPGGAYGVNGWDVQLLSDGVIVTQAQADPTIVGSPAEYVAELDVGNVRGDELTVTIEPRYVDADWAHTILYDSTDYPSSLSIEPDDAIRVDANVSRPVMAGYNATFQASTLGGEPPYEFSWDLGDGTSTEGETVTHTYQTPDTYEVSLDATDADGDSDTHTFEMRALQSTFVDEARAVVAVVDTGINPYHPQFQRPGADIPLDEFVNTADNNAEPRVIDLAEEGPYVQRVYSDDKDLSSWESIDHGELVYFQDTNILGVSFESGTEYDPTAFRVLDNHGHGTAASSSVLNAFPDALLVMVKATAGGQDLADGIEWAAAQPWIDVVSVSWGQVANAPAGYSEWSDGTRDAVENGKVAVVSAGNEPSPLPTDYADGPPWVLSISGSENDGQAKKARSPSLYPDYVSDYTVQAADVETTEDEYVRWSGTSFSAPLVSGSVAGIINGVRDATDHTEGIVDGEIAPGVTNLDVRDALNKTARYPAFDGHVGSTGGDHVHPPTAEYLTAQWGHVDAETIAPATAALLAGDLDIPEEKAEAALYMQSTYNVRAAYWS